MKLAASSLVIRPIVVSGAYFFGTGVISAGLLRHVFDSSLTQTAITCFAAAAVVGTYGGIQAELDGLRKILVTEGLVAQLVPTRIISKLDSRVELTETNVQELSDGVHAILNQPPFVPQSLHGLWRFGTGFLIDRELYTSLPQRLIGEIKRNNELGLKTSSLAFTTQFVLTEMVSESISNASRKLTIYTSGLVFVLLASSFSVAHVLNKD